MEEAHGLCALIWARPTIEIDLKGTTLQPECLAAVARSFLPSLHSLVLGDTKFTRGGGDLSGFRILCTALSDESLSAGLTLLDCGGNSLQADGAQILSKALNGNSVLKSLRCAQNDW